MGMRLLKPSEAQRRSRHDTSLVQVRQRQASDALADVHSQIAASEASFQELLASQRARYALEEQEHAQIVRERIEELKKLDAQLADKELNAEMNDVRAKQKLDEARALIQKTEERQQEMDRAQELMERIIDDAADSKEEYERKIRALLNREQNVKIQEEETQRRARELTDHMTRSLLDLDARGKKCKEKERSLRNKDASLRLREHAIEEKLKEIVKREDAIILAQYQYHSPVKKP